MSARTAVSSKDVQVLILEHLAHHGALSHFQIADATDEAPFRIRAELKTLKRQRLVAEIIRADLHAWMITAAGFALLNERNQLRLGE